MSQMKSKPEHGYWRSLDQLNDSAEYRRFAEGEFPPGASEVKDTEASRRTFLKLMGASVALAGLTACRWPEERIVPFAYRPPDVDPGKPLRFATAMELGGVAVPLVATSYDGRPIKVDGNAEHPSSMGASSALAQASVLGLYDPERSRGPAQNEAGQLLNRNWDTFVEAIRPVLTASEARSGQGMAVLAESSSSPTRERMKARLLARFPQARWVEYEAISRDAEREGTRIAFGRPMRPVYDLENAEIIVSLEDDFLVDHPDALRLARDYAAGRRGENFEMNRLHVFESVLSVTGAQADHRHPMPSGAVTVAALRLAAEVMTKLGGGTLPRSLATVLDHPFRPEMVEGLAEALRRASGRVAIMAGARQPAVVHAVAHALNDALGAVGRTVRYVEDAAPEREAHDVALAGLTRDMNEGRVDTLVVLGGNPVYDAPGALGFEDALAKVDTSIHLSVHRDETSQACTWHVNRAHYLESWDDARAWDGTISVVQPLIRPLFEGRTPSELLAMLAGSWTAKAHDLVRETHALTEKDWRRWLHDGLAPATAWSPTTPSLRADEIAAAVEEAELTWPAGEAGALELVIFPDSTGTYDGRFATNHWLQETPDPMTKVVWDNAALVSPATADALGLEHTDVVKITAGGRTVEAPVYVMPGQAAFSVGLSLGYGRRVATEPVVGQGADANVLRAPGAMNVLRGVTLEKTGRQYELVSTQDHFAMDEIGASSKEERIPYLVRSATLEKYKKNPEKVAGKEYKLFDLWSGFEYDGYKWGMSIDLSTCTGCAACVVACQAENNIPVVGKERVSEGREMHWLRIDRYFEGEVDEPKVLNAPVTCMHCEDAPCEQVCPVAATVHDSEGLNVMVYNRCVGTRYCSNNCPYKVRRFNFFNYRKDVSTIEAMQYNPEVTVRSRGVMEKCTFCTQRITAARIQAKLEDRRIRDGEVVTACQQACPTQAIVFGDLNDPESRVRKLHESERSYAMLDYLNIKPRTRYLVKLRNPAKGSADSEPGHDGSHAEGHA